MLAFNISSMTRETIRKKQPFSQPTWREPMSQQRESNLHTYGILEKPVSAIPITNENTSELSVVLAPEKDTRIMR